MSRFVPNETDAIDIGDGDVVHIKRRMSYGDQRVLSSVFTGADPSAGLREYLAVLLERNIESWAGPGFADADGQPAPITRDAIDALDSDVADRLVDEISSRNPTSTQSARPLVASATSSSPRSSSAARSTANTPNSDSPSDSVGPGTSS